MEATVEHKSTYDIIWSEKALILGLVTTVLFMLFGKQWLGDLSSRLSNIVIFIWLFAIMLWLAFNVVRHADALAVKLGEPYGTLVLTLAVISIEVVIISAVMLTGKNNPTLARDMMFSVLMIVLNGMFGLTLVIGGIKHLEQVYNLEGSKAYLGVLTPLAILGLVLPRFSSSAPGGEVSLRMGIFLLVMSVCLYVVFLFIQTKWHSKYFKGQAESKLDLHHGFEVRSTAHHSGLLIFNILPIVLLSKYLAVIIDHSISSMGAPQQLGGFLVAIIVLSPEAMTATKAALANQLQRTVNISLGSALSTIGLTIPAILAISLLSGRTIELGLGPEEITLLLLTLLVSTINISTQRTNLLQGVVHLIIFFAYIVLIFD